MKRAAIVALAGLFTAAAPAGAETLCGTVRNGQTSAPISRAGVFVFQAGQYTGLHAGTGLDGRFCIDPIHPGVYDVQVRRDDYAPSWITGVIVDGSPTGVDLSVPTAPPLSVYPNPVRSRVTLGVTLASPESATLAVFDVSGRLRRGWTGPASGDVQLAWDLRDAAGARLSPGIYFVQLRAGEHRSVRRLVIVP
jgi:hypothetical protein